jgi:nitrogen fixation NifU-like protein
MNLEILKIASNTENHKVIKNHTHYSKNKNPICGDEMHISLIIKDNQVIDFGYQCKSCIFCQASVSLLSRKVIKLSLSDVSDLLKQSEFFFSEKEKNISKKWKIFEDIMNPKNISRKECLLLPFKTLSKALKL